LTDWIRCQKPLQDLKELGCLQLAWLGDAVWEMHQRLRHCHRPGNSKDLHISVVSEVRAASQAKALTQLDPYLNANERNLIKRGRNRSKRGPRGVDAATYGKATGFETMVGWLFLKEPERLAHLFALLEESKNDFSSGE
tara:strand:+ start:474 stop:890 length:417 start_codon:yes stop_codon:yes gene_type:complete